MRKFKELFFVLTILTSGGRPVKSVTGKIRNELPDERKEIIKHTSNNYPIFLN